MDFNTDCEFGKKGEEKIWLCLLKSKKTKEVVDVRNDKFFQELDIDFLQTTTDGSVNKIEVKTDRMAHKTGNIAYETMSFGKTGCMARTKADYVYYCIDDNGKTYVLTMETLKPLINSETFKAKFQEVDMGDKAKGYLIPLSYLVENKVAFEVNTNG